MDIVNILKRKDGSSVVVAIVVGLFVSSLVQAWSTGVAQWITGAHNDSGSWKSNFWMPLVLFVVEVIILELVTRIYVFLAANVKLQSK